MLRIILISLIFYTINVGALGLDPFYHKKAEGWFWYEGLSRLKLNQSVDDDNSSTLTDPVAIIERYQQQLDLSLKQALVSPTIENVAAYLKMQQQLFSNANNFANTWKQTLMYYPELDPTVKQPISHLGRQLYLSEQQKQVNDKINELAKDNGLLFFFKGKCVYCHEFAKTIKNFSDRYNWQTLAVSLDGGKITEFPDSKTDNGIAERLSIYAVPALMIRNSTTEKIIPITFGLISEQELIERISLVFNLGGKS